jgi:ABC-2 type transport system permease protein
VRLFFLQLRGEFRKLWARPRTYFGFAGSLLLEIAMSLLLRIPHVRIAIARDLWRSRLPADATLSLSGLTTAAHMMGEAITAVGMLALVLVGSDLLCQEAEDGTLRMILCRPVSRTSILFQKLIVGAVYSGILALFIAASALCVGLAFEGRGPLIILAPHEGIIGMFEFELGLKRIGLAALLLAASACSGMVLGFALGCFKLKPAAAMAIALTLLFSDDIVRAQPALKSVRPYCVTTRLLTWRHVFNNEISWLRLRRNYRTLLWMDLGSVAVAWVVFQRREFKQ